MKKIYAVTSQLQYAGSRIRKLIIFLTTAHISHATEEYFGGLWEIYPPAIFLCNFFSNPETGFLVINCKYVTASIGNLILVQKNLSAACSMIWVILFLQALNVIGHLTWTIARKGYTPGVATALIILFILIIFS